MGAGTVGTLTSALVMWLTLYVTEEKANVVEADIGIRRRHIIKGTIE